MQPPMQMNQDPGPGSRLSRDTALIAHTSYPSTRLSSGDRVHQSIAQFLINVIYYQVLLLLA